MKTYVTWDETCQWTDLAKDTHLKEWRERERERDGLRILLSSLEWQSLRLLRVWRVERQWRDISQERSRSHDLINSKNLDQVSFVCPVQHTRLNSSYADVIQWSDGDDITISIERIVFSEHRHWVDRTYLPIHFPSTSLKSIRRTVFRSWGPK